MSMKFHKQNFAKTVIFCQFSVVSETDFASARRKCGVYLSLENILRRFSIVCVCVFVLPDYF